MKPSNSRNSGRRGRGPRRRNDRSRNEVRAPQTPTKTSLWAKILAFFKPSAKSASKVRPTNETRSNGRGAPRQPAAEVTTTKLYVGNLSYETTESDLQELFNGVGIVQTAEIVTHKHNDRSKGFGFVAMATVDEAQRAVTELHDREFMGRKLIVNGAKASDREPDYRG
ncbi:MAG: hypothetical protein JWQ44_2728 [Chthoniobacter sp.]|jgi:RNA recognition motif-containing protein|nr:hypothetical protein [Chthoniobacter sp.]